MDEASLISVLMPVYNAEKYLKQSIESILNQSYSNFEFIIFDDASTDSSLSIIQSYEDPRIKIISSKTNKGYLIHLNHGLSIAQGEYIARMDADDISHSDRFQLQIDFLKRNEDHALVGTNYNYINEEGHPISYIQKPFLYKDNSDIQIYSLFYNPFLHPSIMLRRKDILELQLKYNPKFYVTEDFHFWTHLLFKKKGANLPQELISYRIHKNQITKTSSKQQQSALKKLIPIILEKKGIPFTENDALLHSYIPLSLHSTLSYSTIKEIEEWLLKIRAHFYKKNEKETINKIIEQVWFFTCRKGKGEGLKLFKLYKKSTLSFNEDKKKSQQIFLLALFGNIKLLKKIGRKISFLFPKI